jgi:hypothetical protein
MIDTLEFAVIPAEQFREQLTAPPLSAQIFPFGIGFDLTLLRANVFESPQDLVSSIFQPAEHIHCMVSSVLFFTHTKTKINLLTSAAQRIARESKH